MLISNQFTNDVINLIEGENRFQFFIPSFNLKNGKYSLNFFGEELSGVFDKIENSYEFDVVESDFYGTGKYPKRKKHGIVLFKNSFKKI